MEGRQAGRTSPGHIEGRRTRGRIDRRSTPKRIDRWRTPERIDRRGMPARTNGCGARVRAGVHGARKRFGARFGLIAIALLPLIGGCATVAELMQVQPPRFEAVAGRPSELRLLGPSAERPLGGAAIRLWSRVENPNRFGLTLTTLQGDLTLEDARAATVDLPLGLPLAAGQDTIIPIEVAISFADLPGLADAAVRFATRQTIGYRLNGSFSVDAGAFGQPRFGPMTLLQGDLDVHR